MRWIHLWGWYCYKAKSNSRQAAERRRPVVAPLSLFQQDQQEREGGSGSGSSQRSGSKHQGLGWGVRSSHRNTGEECISRPDCEGPSAAAPSSIVEVAGCILPDTQGQRKLAIGVRGL